MTHAAGAWLATTGVPEGSGWLYNVLTRAGVSPGTTRSILDFVVRPLWVVLVVVGAVVVAKLGAAAIRRLLGRVAHEAAGRSSSPRATARTATLVALTANLWRAAVYITAGFIILGTFGVNLTPILASATIIGATIGFGAQSLVRDYLSGFLLTLEDQFGIGDVITVGDTTGTVEALSLRVTRVRSFDGTVVYLPNGDIRRLANTSRGWAKAIVDLTLSPTDPAELDHAKRLVATAAGDLARSPRFAPSCTEPPQVMGLVGADATTCLLRVALRTSHHDRDALERALREAAIKALSEEHLWPSAAPAEPPAAT
ncbi:MAG TPA: mechanosensitive ion channel family protein [Acidimicrobiales bacterium]|nr:mechanosensitive ion channel family protein [Acidimicrobiales bacterium]